MTSTLDFDGLMDNEGPPPEPNVPGPPRKPFRRSSALRPQVEVAEPDFTRLRVVKTAKRCKICLSPERAEIDKMIYLQRLGRHDADGKIGVQKVLDFMASRGVENANHINIRNHWHHHTEVITVTEEEQTEKLLDSLMSKLTPEQIETMPRAEMLDLMMRQGVAEAGARLRTTGKSGITIEHVLKMAELQIREKGSEAQNEFLKALGGGIVAAIAPGRPKDDQTGRFTKQIAPAEVVDANIVEVPDEEELVA